MKSIPLEQATAEAPSDWLDAVLGAHAAGARPADAGFSTAVLAALPPARNGLGAQRRARLAREFDLATALAVGLCAAAVVTLAPQALETLETLANAPRPTAWLAPETLEALLPPLALATWLAWWSVRQAAGNR